MKKYAKKWENVPKADKVLQSAPKAKRTMAKCAKG